MSLDGMMDALHTNQRLQDAIGSLVLVVGILLVRTFALRLVRAHLAAGDPILRATAQIKRGSVVLIVLGLGFIWATEIQTMALSLTAIAVAIVLATKEMLLCVMGAILRASAKSFTVGDRIEIRGIRGDVIDHGLFATTVIEVGPGHRWTGRSITLPNSVMLTEPVINETYSHAYVLHIMRIPLDTHIDARDAEKTLVAAATSICAPFVDEAIPALVEGATMRGLEPPITDPHIIVQIPEAGKRELLLRLPVPVRDKGDIEQHILREYLDWAGATR